MEKSNVRPSTASLVDLTQQKKVTKIIQNETKIKKQRKTTK